MTETNEKGSLSRCDHLQIEAYRTLNLWNMHDGRAVMAFDAGAIAFVIASFTRLFDSNGPVWWAWCLIVFSVIVLWFIFAYKYAKRSDHRFKLMRNIECHLDISAISALNEFIQSNRAQKHIKFEYMRWLILGVVLVTIICRICRNVR